MSDADRGAAQPQARPSFAEAARFWVRLGFISFGGPAGQIAIMHREVVEQRGWLSERSFANALNFCMLLPGPEALQLAIYLGWRLHGHRGGLVAGICFILPAALILAGLSYVYASYGELPIAQGVLLGLKAAVVAIVVQALVRIGRRALDSRLHLAIAVAAFLAMELFDVPFPLIILAAGIVGALAAWRRTPEPGAAVRVEPASRSGRVLLAGLLLWLLPWLGTGALVGFGSLWARIYLFFTQTAFVTFGGAYAVLGYVTERLVEQLGWLTAEQAVAGLALAETTPGPLVIVLQFMGFMAGWNNPSPFAATPAALFAALLASWATFLPSFVLIFLGAPYVERIAGRPRAAAALAAITAAVVGIIATLALLLARVVFLPRGLGAAPSWASIVIAAVALVLLLRTRPGLQWVLVIAVIAGLIVQALGLP